MNVVESHVGQHAVGYEITVVVAEEGEPITALLPSEVTEAIERWLGKPQRSARVINVRPKDEK